MCIDRCYPPGMLGGGGMIKHRREVCIQSYTMSGFLLLKNEPPIVFCLLCLIIGSPNGFADALEFSPDDTVTITAERAWEDDEPGVIHFSGQFVLRAPDWYVSSDTAVVYGNLDKPDKLILEGKPAKILLLRGADNSEDSTGSEESVEGAASIIEYFRATDKLTLRGAASLTRAEDVLNSELIEYDIDADRYTAGGAGGVNIQLNPEN